MPANINETTVAIKIILFYTFAGEQLLCCYALTIHCYLTYCGHINQEVLVNSFDNFFNEVTGCVHSNNNFSIPKESKV